MAQLLRDYGLYRGISVRLRIDPQRRESLLSTDFTLSNLIPLNVRVHAGVTIRVSSGPLQVPTRNGRYICSYPTQAGYLRDVDVISLGRHIHPMLYAPRLLR